MSVPSPVDASITLEDKYTSRSGRVFVSGTQALVRLPILQRQRDKERGFNTAGFISGYRGSPLANYDTALWSAKKHLAAADIVFQPGLNEELAATAVWGTQQVALSSEAKVDGVFSIWYAKGPGVDRAMDAVKHANSAGTSPLGGVLAVFGDDHGAQSSTMLHQSEAMFEAACIPVLNPSDVQEHVTFGLHGFALSRFAGCWVGLKATTEVVESSASIDAGDLPLPALPDDFDLPRGGLGIRWPDSAVDQELRMQGLRMTAIAAFARANPIDRLEFGGQAARLGLVTTGKAYQDVKQALVELGIDEARAASLGLRLYKVGMSWPLEVQGALHFAAGLDEVLVVEEKRAFLEPQIAMALRTMDQPPRIVGKTDHVGAPLLPSHGELSPLIIATALVSRMRGLGMDLAGFESRLLAMSDAAKPVAAATLARTPFFCSGCPHSSSTKVPDGSRALAGTGCHSMAMAIPSRNAAFLTQMGGEGVNWIGQSPFVDEAHVFVNLGDGTFSHSGLLAVRASAAAGVNVTYKILYNDAVAMTGGQENDAHLTVPRIAHQVQAEGARRIVVLAEQPSRHNPAEFPPGVEILDRDQLDRIQRELRDMTGLTVIIFDQVCAAEKRRRRKRKLYPEGPKRVFINEAVCEACGDCSVQSNCISVAPLSTPLGRKRVIDQSSCNSDYSCLKGFCPSFVTLHGATLRKETLSTDHLDAAIAALHEPERPRLAGAYNILTTGVGGTGIVTVGAVLGMAAHLEGLAVSVLDFTGLAQKNGAVISHVRIATDRNALGPTRMLAGSADLVLACDGIVAAGVNALSRMSKHTQVVLNTHVPPPGAFVLNTSIDLGNSANVGVIRQVVGNRIDEIDGARIAVRLMGDSIYANLFMLGFAWQKGHVPVSLAALLRAIELNGAAVPANKRALALGRLAAVTPEAFDFINVDKQAARTQSLSGEGLIADRRERLVAYQNEAYAARFDRLVTEVKRVELGLGSGGLALTEAVARNLYKLMAYKDEYEVARLYSNGEFEKALASQFEAGGRREVHLAPPLFARRDPVTGVPRKTAFGPWMFKAFGVLARMKGLRNTPLDVFGYTAERRRERDLIGQYEETMISALATLHPGNMDTVLALAELPATIRGYGHIKDRSIDVAQERRLALVAELGRSMKTAPGQLQISTGMTA